MDVISSQAEIEKEPVYVLETPYAHGTCFKADFDEDSITGFTSFGRMPEMQNKLLEYFSAKKSEPAPQGGYHIFFAAASVFCEPYYFAMLARKAGLLDDGFLTIHATDLKDSFLKYAKRGIYPEKTLQFLPEDFRRHFSAAAEGTQRISDDIIDAVKFETPADIRDHKAAQPYDAVVLTNVIYHYHRAESISTLFNAALSLSRGLVVTDFTSFEENRYLFEQAMLRQGFGAANDDLGYSPLQQTRQSHSLAERVIPWRRRGPLTDIKGDPETGTFWAVRAPGA